MSKNRKIRLYIDFDIKQDNLIDLNNDQNHYISNVMRCKNGDVIKIFNEACGEWNGIIVAKDNRVKVMTKCLIRTYQPKRDKIVLAFSPTKKYGEFSVEKATEMGVNHIIPIKCERSVVDKINYNRYSKAIIEAAEQCGRIDLPKLSDMIKVYDLKKHLNSLYPNEQVQFLLCDLGKSPLDVANDSYIQCIIVGPEGGFDQEDYKFFNQINFQNLNLGEIVLRAETACIASIATVKLLYKPARKCQ